jgi:hypothetical protein
MHFPTHESRWPRLKWTSCLLVSMLTFKLSHFLKHILFIGHPTLLHIRVSFDTWEGGWDHCENKIFIQLSFVTWCFLVSIYLLKVKSYNLKHQLGEMLSSLCLGKILVISFQSLHAQVQDCMQDKINRASSVCLRYICIVF